MEVKHVRRTINLVSGLGVAALSVFLIFYLDILLHINVNWLLGISAFGLIGGALLALSSANIEDDENWKAPIMAIVGTILMLLYDVVLVFMFQDEMIMEFTKYNSYFAVIYYIILGLSAVLTFIALYGSCVENNDN